MVQDGRPAQCRVSAYGGPAAQLLLAAVLERGRPTDVPMIIWRALSERLRVTNHRHVHALSGVKELLVRSLDDRLLPLQVDGDYIGDAREAAFGVTPRGIMVVS